MTNDNTEKKPLGTLFLYIPVARLILLSIASCGLYEAYWIYKNWWFIKEREGLNIRPFWRGIFGILFCHSLLKKIHEDTEARAVLEPAFSPGGLAIGFIILAISGNLLARGPGVITSIIAFVMPSYLCLVPVQNYINSVCEKQSENTNYYGWSAGHVVCLVLGLIFWVLAFIPLGN